MLNLKINFRWPLILALVAFSFFSCKKKEVLSNLAGLTSFSINELQTNFTIDEAQQKIFNSDSLPFGTDVTRLTAKFTSAPYAKVWVGVYGTGIRFYG